MRGRGYGIAMVVLACVVPVEAAHGDMYVPIASETADENYSTMRFDNLADYPDFDFYLKYNSGNGNPPPHLTRVESGKPTHLEGGRHRLSVFLLAVPRGRYVSPIESKKTWSADSTDFIRSAPLEGSHLGTGYLVPYRIRIQDGELLVTVQPREWLIGEWSIFWLKRLPYLLVPITFCAALGWLGVRTARRLFPSKQTSSASAP